MKISLLIVLSLLFIGCGSDDDTSNVVAPASSSKVALCSDAVMTEVQAGDVVTNDEVNTRIKVMHKATEKLVCVSQGSASIVKN